VAVGGGGGGPYTFRWDFGDGNNSTAQDPTHTYVRAGDYNATVVVTNVLGVSTRESYSLFAYDRVPVDLSVRVPSPVLAGAAVPVSLAASVECPQYAPAGCNVTQVSVVVRLSAPGSGATTVAAFPASGDLEVNLTAPNAWGPSTLNVSVVGPNYEGTAQATVQVELITFVPAMVIGGVLVVAAVAVSWVWLRRKRAASP
jgi:PKD repeat protein